MTEADPADRATAKGAGGEDAFATSPDRSFGAERREWARVARPSAAARHPGDMASPLSDQAHVATRGADVLRRDVAAVESRDRIGEIEQRATPPRPLRAPV